jgi:haloalkane dehalogenase
MRQTISIPIEHIVVASNRSYDQVKESLEARLGVALNLEELVRQLAAVKASWEQTTQTIEKQLGTSGFSLFSKVDHGALLSLAGNPRRVSQYAIGNPLLALQMVEHLPEVAMYAPLRLAVYQEEGGKTFVAYDRFSSLLPPSQPAEILPIAQLVEQKLEALVAEVTGGEQATYTKQAPQHASPLQEERPASAVQERLYTEHRILRGASTISARHYAGTGPAVVLMHGFPDNLHIYDRLIPYLGDRQVITFDFLGWGASDKPIDYPYTSKQQEGDLQAVLDALGVEQVVLVPHDASGPVAINWALDHPERVSALVLLNTYYADAPTLRFPEFISLFADPAYAALTRAMAKIPDVARWLLTWQGAQFSSGEQGQETLLPMVLPQFADTPSTFPAFIALTSDLHATLQADTQRLPLLKTFDRPVRIIFGAGDPYLNPGVAEHFHEAFPTSELFLLHKGHWPQLDGPEEVARLLLSVPVTTKSSKG